jgi:hypothetical protein
MILPFVPEVAATFVMAAANDNQPWVQSVIA